MASKRTVKQRIVEIHKAREARKLADPTCEMADVIELMERHADELDKVPEGFKYSNDMLETLEDARHSAIKLKLNIEAIFDSMNLNGAGDAR